MMREIWVLVQHRHGELDAVTPEVLAEAREAAWALGAGVCALVLGGPARPDWQEALAGFGAERIYRAVGPDPGAFEPYSGEVWAAALSHLLRKHRPLSLWLGATADGRDLAPRLAARLEAPLAAGCVSAAAGGADRLTCTRPVLGGRLHAAFELPLTGRPCLVTFRPGFRGREQPRAGSTAPVVTLAVPQPPPERRVRHREFVPADHRTVDIREAARIVGAGGGAGGEAGLKLVEELADLLGAAVGGTRVAVDRGLLPFARQIGSTGKVVAPQLYVACGISGAVQHTAGLVGVRDLIAINTDRTAPIMAMADLAVVGDAPAVLRALIQRLRVRRRGAPPEPAATGKG